MNDIFDQDHTIPVQNPTYPMANLKSSAYAAPLGFNRPTEALGGYDTQVNPMTGQEMPQTNFARGGKVDDFTSALHDGMAAYAQGGPVQHFKFGDKVGGEGSTSGLGISLEGTPGFGSASGVFDGGGGQIYTYDPNSFGGFGGGYSGGSKGLDDALGYITETVGGLTEYGQGLADFLASNVNIAGGEQTNAAALQQALANEGTHISLDQASNIINQASAKANASLDSGVNLAAAYDKTGGADMGGAGGNGLTNLGEVTVLGARPGIFDTIPTNVLGGIDPRTGQFTVPELPGTYVPDITFTTGTEDPSLLGKIETGGINALRNIGRGAINVGTTALAGAINPWLAVASKLGGVGETVANKIIPKSDDLTALPEVVVKGSVEQPYIYVPPLIDVGSYFDRFKVPIEDVPTAGTELDPVTVTGTRDDGTVIPPPKPAVVKTPAVTGPELDPVTVTGTRDDGTVIPPPKPAVVKAPVVTGTELDPVTVTGTRDDGTVIPSKTTTVTPPPRIQVPITYRVGDDGSTATGTTTTTTTTPPKTTTPTVSTVTPDDGRGDGGGGGTTPAWTGIPLAGAFRSAYDPMYSASTSERYGGSAAQNLQDYMASLNQSLRPGPITPYTFQTAPERVAIPQTQQGVASLQSAPSRQYQVTQPSRRQAEGIGAFVPDQVLAPAFVLAPPTKENIVDPGMPMTMPREIPIMGDGYYPDMGYTDRKQIGPTIGMGGEEAFAHGGIAYGGLGSLAGTYKAGGKLLRGPGDGMSDSIPAVIHGKQTQRAALADGEFVIPADVVSHLGNGSTDAGARKLYAMMNKIRQARTGRTRQAPEVSADRYMPKA